MNYNKAKQYARELRKNQTNSETAFWKRVRNRKFYGFKFTRQFPISYQLKDNKVAYFIADFYCHSVRLIIEIDGDYHKMQRQYDHDRTSILEALNNNVLRFDNDTVIDNWMKVESQMLDFLENLEN